MSILADQRTRLLVQGITGRQGAFHTAQMLEYGTKVVAGATPGRGGTAFHERVPVYDSADEAVQETGANTSIIFVPAPQAADAIVEAADAGVSLILCITDCASRKASPRWIWSTSFTTSTTKTSNSLGRTAPAPSLQGTYAGSESCRRRYMRRDGLELFPGVAL